MPVVQKLGQFARRLLGAESVEAVAESADETAEQADHVPDPLASWRHAGSAASGTLTDAEVLALENTNVPSIQRDTDAVEAEADERQDLTTSLNFPLHRTCAASSWNYLFDFSVACQLLGPRPDDLVLDFAAGTGWASELLTRIGVRTVSVDLSVEMMRRCRTRLFADSRLELAGEAQFVAARGQALPFRDGAFDGVICLNALHHLPSLAEGLREIYRVLGDGGRAVFSEPGTEHAAQPLSQYRMREEHVLEKNVFLAAVYQVAMTIGFTEMRLVPLRDASTYVVDFGDIIRGGDPLSQVWSDTLRHYPREKARFVLHKGSRAAEDTLLPAEHLAGRLAASIELVHATASVAPGAPFTDRLRIGNTGTVTWKATGRRFGGQVTCGLKICDESGNVIREDLGRTPLPRDVPPGGVVQIDMRVSGIDTPGTVTLRYDMVVEGVTWFEFQGSPCTSRSLQIE
jgi:SAM-dependent methyltransferase